MTKTVAGEAVAAKVLGDDETDNPLDVGKALGTLSSVLSTGYKIYEFFAGDSAPDLAAMIARLPDQIRTVIRQEETQAAITNATAAANDASSWLTIDYVNLLKSTAKDVIYNSHLIAGDGLAKLEALESELSIIELWTNSGDPAVRQQSTQTIAVYLTLANLILAFYQERARNAAAPTDELNNIKGYATRYKKHATELLDTVIANRIAAVADINDSPVSYSTYCFGFEDSWLASGSILHACSYHWETNRLNGDQWQEPDDLDGAKALVKNIRDAHIALLNSGSETDYRTLRGYCLQGGFNEFNAVEYGNRYLFKIRQFGKWYASCRATVPNINKLATNPLPDLPADQTQRLPNVEFSFTHDGSVNPPWGNKKVLAPPADGAFYPVYILDKKWNDSDHHEPWAWGFTYYPDQTLEVAYGRWVPEFGALSEEALVSKPIKLDIKNLSQQTSVAGYDQSHTDYTETHSEARFSFD